MYLKNLNNFINLRISYEDFIFIKNQSEKYSMSISEYLRQMITQYRLYVNCEDKFNGNE